MVRPINSLKTEFFGRFNVNDEVWEWIEEIFIRSQNYNPKESERNQLIALARKNRQLKELERKMIEYRTEGIPEVVRKELENKHRGKVKAAKLKTCLELMAIFRDSKAPQDIVNLIVDVISEHHDKIKADN